MLADWRGGKVFEFVAGKSLAGIEAVGLICAGKHDKARYIAAGGLLQRISRASAAHGYETVPMQQPLLLFVHAAADTEMPEHVREEIIQLKQRFEMLFGDASAGVCLFALRKMTDAPVLPKKAPEKVLSYGKPE